MIISILLGIGLFIFYIFLAIVSAMFGGMSSFPVVPSGIGYIFGNIYLLNDFLPVTEFFALFVFAVSIKLVFFTWKVVLFMLDIFNTVRRTFLTFRG